VRGASAAGVLLGLTEALVLALELAVEGLAVFAHALDAHALDVVAERNAEELLGERAKTKEAATPEKTPAQSVVQGELGRDRKGKVVVGEVDPQRKRKALEGAYLEARRELRDLACTCKTCDRPFVFTVAEQEFFAAQGWPIPRPRCKACSTSKKSGTKRAAKGASALGRSAMTSILRADRSTADDA
jgi:hypothetical protein